MIQKKNSGNCSFLLEPLCNPPSKECKDGIDDDPNEKGFIPVNISEHEDHAR